MTTQSSIAAVRSDCCDRSKLLLPKIIVVIVIITITITITINMDLQCRLLLLPSD